MHRSRLLSIVLASLSGVAAASATPIYVDAGQAPGGGSSWSSPFHDLQSALDAARLNPAITVIYVARGTYLPGTSASSTFLMVPGVMVFAGYPTGGGAYDPVANPVILEGDLGAGVHAEHVVTCDGGMYLDGVTIRNGNAGMGFGGGIYVKSGWGRLANSTVENNVAYGGGGVAAIPDARLWLYNDTIRNNVGVFGGGVYCNSSQASAMNRVTLSSNSASSYGGGLWANGTLYAESILISSNSASVAGGVYAPAAQSSSISLVNCTVANNAATSYGGGVVAGLISSGSLFLGNSIIWGNTAPMAAQATGDVFGMYSDIQDLAAASVSSLWCISSDPKFSVLGTYRLQATSPCVDTGLNSYVVYSLDRDGNSRIAKSAPLSSLRVDMGAFERSTVAPLIAP